MSFIGEDNINWAEEARRVAKEEWRNTGDAASFDYFVHLLKPGMRVLDLGCNISRWHSVFMKLNLDLIYEGLDPCGAAIDIARERYPQDNYYHMKGEDMNFTSRFNLVFTHTVLQHVSNETKKKIITKVWKALKKGGLFIIQESTDPSERTFTRRGWIQFIVPFGFRYLGGTADKDSRNGFIFKKEPKILWHSSAPSKPTGYAHTGGSGRP